MPKPPIDVLLRKYKPYFAFHSGESYYPCDLDAYISCSKLFFNDEKISINDRLLEFHEEINEERQEKLRKALLQKVKERRQAFAAIDPQDEKIEKLDSVLLEEGERGYDAKCVESTKA